MTVPAPRRGEVWIVEVEVGPDHGVAKSSVVNLDNTQLISRTQFRRRVARLDAITMERVCDALAISVGCR